VVVVVAATTCSLRADLAYLAATCDVDADCEPAASECKRAACELGVCVHVVNAGAVVPDGVGNCTLDRCEAQGSRSPEFDAADVPPQAPSCRQYACTQIGVPDLLEAGDGAPCESGYCNQGTCVECLQDQHCMSATEPRCVASTCVSEQCANMVQSELETDEDCGGPACAKCADGQMCLAGTDCQSGVCGSDGRCAAPTCSDRVRNGSEPGTDCGVVCAIGCPPGEGCLVSSDCESLVCDFSTFVCLAPSCKDDVQNGGETDTDCGEVCAGVDGLCDIGETCLSRGDCASYKCAAGVCAVSCFDGLQNQGEAGVDCGGPCQQACGAVVVPQMAVR